MADQHAVLQLAGVTSMWLGYEAMYLTHKKKKLSNWITGKSLIRRLHVYGGYGVFTLLAFQMMGGALKYKTEVFDLFINMKYHRILSDSDKSGVKGREVDRHGSYHGDINSKGELVNRYFGEALDYVNKFHGVIGRVLLAAMPITALLGPWTLVDLTLHPWYSLFGAPALNVLVLLMAGAWMRVDINVQKKNRLLDKQAGPDTGSMRRVTVDDDDGGVSRRGGQVFASSGGGDHYEESVDQDSPRSNNSM